MQAWLQAVPCDPMSWTLGPRRLAVMAARRGVIAALQNALRAKSILLIVAIATDMVRIDQTQKKRVNSICHTRHASCDYTRRIMMFRSKHVLCQLALTARFSGNTTFSGFVLNVRCENKVSEFTD